MGPERNKDTNGYKSGGENYVKASADDQFAKMNYDSRWITDAATAEMIDYTRNAGKFMAKNDLTNSKIRSIYGEIKRIQMGEFEKEKSSFFRKIGLAGLVFRRPGVSVWDEILWYANHSRYLAKYFMQIHWRKLTGKKYYEI